MAGCAEGWGREKRFLAKTNIFPSLLCLLTSTHAGSTQLYMPTSPSSSQRLFLLASGILILLVPSLTLWMTLPRLLSWFLLKLDPQVSVFRPLPSLDDFIEIYYFKYHLYPDNFQIYIPSLDLSPGFQALYNCLLDILTWDVRHLKLRWIKPNFWHSKSILSSRHKSH